MSSDPIAIFETPKEAKSATKAASLDDDASRNDELLIPDIPGKPISSWPPSDNAEAPVKPIETSNNGNEVLFDAKLDVSEPEDEFGEFETVETEKSLEDDHFGITTPGFASEAAPSISNLIDFDDNLEDAHTFHQNLPSKPRNDLLADGPLTVSENEQANIHPTSSGVRPSEMETPDLVDDEWEPFEDGQISNAMVDQEKPAETSPAVPSHHSPTPVDEPRPNNVPPPVILLGVLPQIFQQLKKESVVKSTDTPKLISQSYQAAAYVIAGRTLRWKRDTILSQSMKIGPASASRKGGGMKLAAVDKSESLKEEREVGEAVHTWQQLAHSFQRALRESGTTVGPMTLSSKLKIKTLKGPSTITSTHACALCGLKRDERLAEAAFDVEDSFGEFWVEQWGHRDCRDFWQRYKNLLQTR